MKARHPLPLHPDMDCGFTAWTPSGVKREKHRVYNRLVSVIQRLCALCFSLLFFMLLKPKFSDEIFVEDKITDSGDDWTFKQHKVIDITPTEQDFKKVVADFLAWKVGAIMRGEIN